MNEDDENTNYHRYGHRTNSAWYFRNRYYNNGDTAWQFLGYTKPTAFYLQSEYLEIKT